MCAEPDLKSKVLSLIEERTHVTFVEIMKMLPEEKGDFGLAAPGYENIVYWFGMSEALVTAVSELISEREIYTYPTSELTYSIDGGGVKLPLAKSARQYAKPHWLPVTLDKNPPKGL